MLVDTYLNLHKDAVSVKSRETENYGTVVSHEQRVCVSDVEFVVQPAGRKKCIESGTKNVHAFVRGEWEKNKTIGSGTKITYNPFKYDSFVVEETEEPVKTATDVLVSDDGTIVARGIE